MNDFGGPPFMETPKWWLRMDVWICSENRLQNSNGLDLFPRTNHAMLGASIPISSWSSMITRCKPSGHYPCHLFKQEIILLGLSYLSRGFCFREELVEFSSQFQLLLVWLCMVGECWWVENLGSGMFMTDCRYWWIDGRSPKILASVSGKAGLRDSCLGAILQHLWKEFPHLSFIKTAGFSCQ